MKASWAPDVLLVRAAAAACSRVGPGETWGGVPARRIGREEMDRFKEGIRGIRAVEMP